MARKWHRNGALASVFALIALGTAGLPAGNAIPSAISTVEAREMPDGAAVGTVPASGLPREAVATLGLIASGGPYPYSKDGVVFGNFERILPKQRRGYYHEYTVPTPRARNRGAKRIVCGGPLRRIDNCFYSDDHYTSFKRIVE